MVLKGARRFLKVLGGFRRFKERWLVRRPSLALFDFTASEYYEGIVKVKIIVSA
jgi:hypothetical protein